MNFTHREFDTGGATLHVAECGDGPPVVLLHGFPEFWYSWRKQMPYLAANGFRAIAPDLRGYNLSSKPAGVRSYSIPEVAADISALSGSLGEPVTLVGHDWGAAVAWRVATATPELVRRLIILNVPHPAALRRELRTSRQKLRFWYQLALQPPLLPELLLRARNFALLRRAMKKLTTPPISDDDLERYVEAWAQPGSLRAMLSYYRAVARRRPARTASQTSPSMNMPALLIWGDRDPFFNPRGILSSPEFMPSLRLETIRDAGHFVQSDAADEVNRLILRFARDEVP
jgi:pimeloyl-ACP methyl ester carboxylesterase